VQAAGEQLEGKHGARQGFSLVGRVQDPKGAAALAKSLYKKAVSGQSGAKLKKFTVRVLSTAQGITATEKPVATANVYWTEGRCAFGSGLFLPHGSGLSSKQIALRVIAGSSHSTGARTGAARPWRRRSWTDHRRALRSGPRAGRRGPFRPARAGRG